MKKLFAFLFLLAFLSSCSTRVPLKPDYFGRGIRLGILVVADRPEYGYSTSGGIIGAAITAGIDPATKFTNALGRVKIDIDPTLKIQDFYLKYFTSKGVNIIPLNEQLDYNLSSFRNNPLSQDNSKYYFKDVSPLRTKYPIDQVLIVRVRYGAYSSFYYGGEISRRGLTYIYPQIVNLNGNLIVYKNSSTALMPITILDLETKEGLEALIDGIRLSTDNAIFKEQQYIDKTTTPKELK
jgi:hypothetical protein